MSTGLNHCQFIGNLGADPELRSTSSGHSVLKFRVAATERKKVGDHWEDHTEWISVVVWGNRAEGLGKFLAKGMSVYVSAKVRNSNYEDRDGIKRYRTEFVATDVIVFGKGRGGGGGGGEGDTGGGDSSSSGSSGRRRRSSGSRSNDSGAPAPGGDPPYSDANYGGDDDDIPF